MRPPFRLAAIDLDETLLGRDHLISKRNAAAVRSLVERNVSCVIASGRMHESTLRFADELGLRGPIISYNGAMVRDTARGDVWLHTRVPAGPAAEVIAYCSREGHHLNYYLDDQLFVAAQGEWAQFYVRQTRSPMEAIGSLERLQGTEPTKMILIDNPETTDQLMEEFRERFGDTLYITKTNPQYLEFMNPGASKGIALACVANRMGVEREETAAFGDGNNDLPMIQWAGLGVAMATGKSEVKRIADRIAPPFDEDGFAQIVEELLAEH